MHLGSVNLAHMRVDVIDGGAVWLDGGSIFGVVPRVLWSKLSPPDAHNRVRLSYFSLLARSDEATVVIEAGSSAHQPPKVREAMAAEDSCLAETLSSLAVAPEDVDYFIPSHLHFDHVGGASDPVTGKPLFPRARYVFQRTEWDEANNPRPINVSAYLEGDIAPLRYADIMLVDGDAEIAPGVKVVLTSGHSIGHQAIWLGGGGRDSAVFLGDILPTSEHASPRWMCAFDILPETTYDVKRATLSRAAAEGTFVAPGHGGSAPLCTIAESAPGKFVAQRVPAVSPVERRE